MTLWWKCHDDILRHPKTRRLPPLHKVVLWAAFNTASRSPKRGVLYISQGVPAEPFDLADEAGVLLEDALAAIGTPDQRGTLTTKGAQAEKGIWLDWTDDGVLYFPEWKERQYEADATNATRQKRHREKKRLTNKPPPVTESNALRNVTITPPDNRLQSTDKTYEVEEEEGGGDLKELPTELRDNWGRAYQFLCVKDPSATYVDLMAKFKEQAGVTDQLIVHLLETAIKTKRRNFLAWVSEVLTECAANGITTAEERIAFDKEREAEDSGRAASGTGSVNGEAPGVGTPGGRNQAQNPNGRGTAQGGLHRQGAGPGIDRFGFDTLKR